MMDHRYTNALRNATNAWSHNRVTDTTTMQELKRRAHAEQKSTAQETATTLNATQMGLLQPELARYGNLGTKLNLFA